MPDLDALRNSARRLLALLDDPHPGLATWTGMVGERLAELALSCPICTAARAALDAAPGDERAYLVARGWQDVMRGGRDTGWWVDPLAPDQQRAFAGAVEEQRRRDAIYRAGMERALDIANEMPAHRSAGEAALAIRDALPATSTPVRLLDAEAVRAAIDAQRDVDASCSAWDALDGVLRALGIGGDHG